MKKVQEEKAGAIFDLDGTILDSIGVWRQIDVEFLGKRGFEVPNDYMENIAVLNFEQASVYTKERFQLEESLEEIVDEWFQGALQAYSCQVPLKPFAKEYLELLHSRGVKLAVATSSDELLYIPALKRLGIYELFDAFVMAREVPRGKGSPDIYEEAARRLGLSVSECVVYEDVLKALRGAKEGHFCTIGVFDADSQKDWEIMKSEADESILSYEELLCRQGK